jgi:ATP-binding cassette subfamily B protein
MDDLRRYANHPIAFIGRYVRQRKAAHGFIIGAVVAAVLCSVLTQYGVKFLVDSLAAGAPAGVWFAVALVASLIAADNLLWRVASWIASITFVKVTGDLRRDLFRHLTGHAHSYFTDRLPGMLTSRVTAASNALYAIESMFISNVLPPCLATAAAIGLVCTISIQMSAVLSVLAGSLIIALFRLAAAGKPLHHSFADKAAVVDGEMVDVIGNMSLVKAFCALGREHARFDATIDQELVARSRSLLYLERLRLTHAVVTVACAIGILVWAISLWQRGLATTGEVVLACTLGLSVLHATRDLAVALVDVTQHVARLSEALATLLLPHAIRDCAGATPLVRSGSVVEFRNVSFDYPEGRRVFADFSLRIQSGQKVGLVGPSGSGKSTLLALLQRSYDVQRGQILIDGQDITAVTQDSLRASTAVVPQDIALFHRSILENIRYGRPDASDEAVREAASAARCEFIDSMPKGYATIVGDRGVKLSGGQRQRIAIARAFLKDASILLLDEATASLDTDSEEAIREALDHLMHGRTVLAIAHRLSTLRSFDRVVMRRKGPYHDLVRRETMRLGRRAA